MNIEPACTTGRFDIHLVRVEGLEPPCLAAPDPKSGMSTNFTTPAILLFIIKLKIYPSKLGYVNLPNHRDHHTRKNYY